METISKNIPGSIFVTLIFTNKPVKKYQSLLIGFKNIIEKNKCAFIQFEIQYYKRDLKQTINFTKLHNNTTNENVELIKHCRKSIVFCRETELDKKA